jgi:hypothetical protein
MTPSLIIKHIIIYRKLLRNTELDMIERHWKRRCKRRIWWENEWNDTFESRRQKYYTAVEVHHLKECFAIPSKWTLPHKNPCCLYNRGVFDKSFPK